MRFKKFPEILRENSAAILICALVFAAGGCTYKTEVYTYDKNGIETQVFSVVQDTDGVAQYAIKDQYEISVDTRYNPNAGSEPVVSIIKNYSEKNTPEKKSKSEK